MQLISKAALVLFLLESCQAYSIIPTPETTSRRALFHNVAAVVACSVLTTVPASPALASGGATAGKYTTIPIAKRRYYGRVQAGIHEFLALGSDIVQGDMSAPLIRQFFDPQGLIVVEAKRKDVNGQCTKKTTIAKVPKSVILFITI